MLLPNLDLFLSIKDKPLFFFLQWVMLRKGHGGLYTAPTKEERRNRAAKRIER